MRLYLAHPFDLRHSVRACELVFEQRTGIELFNPFYDSARSDIARIDSGEITPYDRDNFVSIVHEDLKEIKKGDGVLAIAKRDVNSVGTVCEAWDTMLYRKPVYLLSADYGNHPWWRYIVMASLGEHFKTWDEAEQYFKGRGYRATVR